MFAGEFVDVEDFEDSEDSLRCTIADISVVCHLSLSLEILVVH